MTFFRKGVLASAGHFAAQLVNVLGTMLLARALEADMGQYDLFRNVATLAVTVASLGIGSANVYVLNGRNAALRPLAATTVKLFAALGTVLAAGLTAAILGFDAYFGRVPAEVAAAFGVAAAATLGVAMLRSFLTARLAVARLVVLDLVAPGVVLAGAAALFPAGRLDARAALLLSSAGQVASLAVLLAFLRRDLDLRAPFDGALLREVLRHGVRNFAANLMGIVLAALTLMLLRYLSLGDGRFGPVSLYTRATALCGMGMMMPAAVGPLLYARWSGALGAERRGQVELAGRLNVAYGMAVAVLLVTSGKVLLRAVYGAAFVPAQAAVYVLGPAYALKGLFDVYINLFASDGRAGLTAAILAGATGVAVVTTWTLVPRWGIVGAGLAVLLAEVFSVTVAAALGRRLYGVRLAKCVTPRWADLRLVAGQLRPGGAAPAPGRESVA